MTIFHDKLGNRLAMTETDALALGYTYKHKGLKMSEKVNQECSSTKANELADAMEIRASIRRKATSRKSVQENANDRLADQLEQAATMLRQQQAEIEKLRSWVEMLVEVPFFNEIDHYRGIPVAILRKASEK